MRIQEAITDLKQRSSWVPVVFKIAKTGMVITRYCNGEWTEKYLRNMSRVSNYPKNIRDLETKSYCDFINLDDCITNHMLKDICLIINSIDYVPK